MPMPRDWERVGIQKNLNIIGRANNKAHSHDPTVGVFFSIGSKTLPCNFVEKTAKSIIVLCTCYRWIIDYIPSAAAIFRSGRQVSNKEEQKVIESPRGAPIDTGN